MKIKKVEFNLILICIKMPILVMKYPFLIHNRVVFKTTSGSYVLGTVSSEKECQNVSDVHSSRNIGRVSIDQSKLPLIIFMVFRYAHNCISEL